jgi:hypothetical protein
LQPVIVGVLGMAALGAQSIEAGVGGHSQQERRWRLVGQSVMVPKQRHEHVLHGVLRLGIILQKGATPPQDHWTVPLVIPFDVE